MPSVRFLFLFFIFLFCTVWSKVIRLASIKGSETGLGIGYLIEKKFFSYRPTWEPAYNLNHLLGGVHPKVSNCNACDVQKLCGTQNEFKLNGFGTFQDDAARSAFVNQLFTLRTAVIPIPLHVGFDLASEKKYENILYFRGIDLNNVPDLSMRLL